MNDAPATERNYVEEYNSLADEANRLLGKTKFNRVTSFVDDKTGELQVETMNAVLLEIQEDLSAKEGKQEPTAKPKKAKQKVKSPVVAPTEPKTKQPQKEKQMAKATTAKKAAKKAPVKKAATATKKAPAKAAAVKKEKPTGPLADILGSRAEGTKKSAMLKLLHSNLNKPVSRSKIVIAAYGKEDAAALKAFPMAMNGLIATVKKAKGYSIERTVDEKSKEVKFALRAKA